MKFLVFSLLALVAADWDMDSGVNIINGKPANDGEIPYQVGLYISIANIVLFGCGGSLISPSFVLTAAHCLKPPAEILVVYLGSIYLGDGIQRTVRQKIIHPEFIPFEDEDIPTFDTLYDIGLLEIDYVEYSENIMSVALPDIYDSYPTYEAYPTITSGWGWNNISTEEASPFLLYTELLVISNNACAEMFGGRLPDDIICGASPISSGSCHGDSGGPLVLRDNTALIGVTSFGTNDFCFGHYATAFTRITNHRQWISDQTGL